MKAPHRFSRRGLEPSPLPRTPGLIVTRVFIYLYRDREARPEKPLGVNPGGACDGPWQYECFITADNKGFCIYTDQPSLALPEPLWVMASAFGLHLDRGPALCSRFDRRLGGAAATPNGDAATVEALFDALRTFPEGWQIRTLGGEEGPPKPMREVHESYPAWPPR